MGSSLEIWNNSIVTQLVAKAIIIFCCFPVHECAHAWMANKLGDYTGASAGRITLNPLKHLDLWGTIMLVLFGFGYAKPVPVNTDNFRSPKRDHAIVSMAGPMANLIMAVTFLFIGLLIHIKLDFGNGNNDFMSLMADILRYAAYINFELTVLNLIPIPPLDGYRVLSGLLPYKFSRWTIKLEKYSTYALLGLFLLFSLFAVSPISSVAHSLYDSVSTLYGVLFMR